jgi:oligosaccharide repeat unit polymerase
MSLVSIIAFLLVFGLGLTMLKHGADVFAPGRLFLIMWCAAIGLADLKLSAYQNEWSPQAWILLLLGLSSFVAGVFVVHVLQVHAPVCTIEEMRQLSSKTFPHERVLFRATLLVFVLYAVSYLGSYLVKGFVPIFTAEPSRMRTQFSVFGLGLLVHAAPAVMLLVVQYLALVRGKTLRKMLLTLVLLITGGSYFLLLQRFDYAIWAVTTAVFVYYSSPYLNWKTVLTPVVAFIGLFYAVQSVRLVGHIENYIYIQARMRFGVQYAILTEPYMYIVMNLENFVRSTQLLEQHTYGFYSLNFAVALSGLKHWIESYWNLNEAPYMIGGYNTYSFLWTYFRDFGVVGIAILPFVEGAVISYLYGAMRRQPSVCNISLYGFAVLAILLSFFFNVFAMLQFVVIVVIVYIVTRRMGVVPSKALASNETP